MQRIQLENTAWRERMSGYMRGLVDVEQPNINMNNHK